MAASGIKPDTQVYYASVYMVQAKKPAVKFIWLAKRTAGGRALPDYWPRDCLGWGGGGAGGGGGGIEPTISYALDCFTSEVCEAPLNMLSKQCIGIDYILMNIISMNLMFNIPCFRRN